jgi:hypothetical protein
LNNDTKFAPIIRISQITEGRQYDGQPALPGPDIAVIVAQWGPLHTDKTHTYYVRGVPVCRTTITENSNGRIYRWCLFPDGRVMKVNEGNINSRKIK